MQCIQCNADNAEGAKFCNECGAGLAGRCAGCGSENAPLAKFCNQCGASLRGVSARSATLSEKAPAAGPMSQTEGERRHLTVLFCDLVGSTEIAARLDPEDWHEIGASY